MPKTKAAQNQNKLKIKKEHIAGTALGLGTFWYYGIVAAVAVVAGSYLLWHYYLKNKSSKK